MFLSLHAKSLQYFIYITLISILLISIAFRLSFEDCFAIYLDNKREDEINRFTEMLESEYEKTKKINSSTIEKVLPFQAMTESLFYRAYDNDGKLVVDSTHLIEEIARIREEKSSNSFIIEDFDLTTEERTLYSKNKEIGKLEIFYNRNYEKGEFQFKQRLNKYMIYAGITILIFGIMISFFYSSKLTVGLRIIRDAAKELQKHNLGVRLPEKNASSEVEQLVQAFNDLAESLSHQETLRKQFSIDISHELRTPISTVRSQLEAFIDGVWEPTPERLKKCNDEFQRLVRLVNDLEELMCAENPELKLEKSYVLINDMLNSTSCTYAYKFEEKNIEFEIILSNKDIWVNVDKYRLNQVIANLLDNSLKYTSKGGKVILFVKENYDNVTISVEDNGVGISKENLPHVFERFYRGDKSRDRKTGGFGIGLSIVKALVTAHKGSICIKSEIGKGTKVILKLPKEATISSTKPA